MKPGQIVKEALTDQQFWSIYGRVIKIELQLIQFGAQKKQGPTRPLFCVFVQRSVRRRHLTSTIHWLRCGLGLRLGLDLRLLRLGLRNLGRLCWLFSPPVAQPGTNCQILELKTTC